MLLQLPHPVTFPPCAMTWPVPRYVQPSQYYQSWERKRCFPVSWSGLWRIKSLAPRQCGPGEEVKCVQFICVCSGFLVGTKKVRYLLLNLLFICTCLSWKECILVCINLSSHHAHCYFFLLTWVVPVISCYIYIAYIAYISDEAWYSKYLSQQITILSVKVSVRNPYFYTGSLLEQCVSLNMNMNVTWH